MRIQVVNSNLEFRAAPDQTLLDAALDSSLNLPHSCKGGNCGACRARLLRGEIHYPNGPPLGLSDAEAAEGMILLCQASARTDLSIETFEMRMADAATPKRLPCRIERTLQLSHDVMGVFLQLPIAEALTFEPGQYIDIMLPGGRRRSFSIASPPHDSRPLELHVRRVAGGEFTDPLFRQNAERTLLTIEGPLGQFAYREGGESRGGQPPGGQARDSAAPPMLLIGGGTGIAPLISILRHVIENGIDRNMQVYWGVRSERDLYAQERLEALAARARMRYIPVLSEPTPKWLGRSGWVHEAAFKDIGELDAHEVYAAGPPAMIAAVHSEYQGRGLSASRLHVDSFDYAPDTLERQRTSAASRS
jgi:CDP-4-dehydro-6-deoxyglucose reductase